MQNELVSVVLPIYNVEKYLNRCIDSIVGQTYRNLEIILVDDGSPDRCPLICDEWAAKDSRIRVIHKQNAGIGMARNSGIEIAHGSYICFFDSDDYIALNAIELAYRHLKNENAQIVCFGFHEVDASGRVLDTHVPDCPSATFSGSQVMESFLPNLIAGDPAKGENWKLNMSAWSAMFSMDLILESGWRFVSERDILSEDIYSITALYKHVSRVTVLREALYFYCQNDQSVSRVYRPDRFLKNVTFHRESLKMCDRLGYSDDIKMRLTRYLLSNTIAAMKQLVASDESFFRKVASLRSILRHEIWKTAPLRALIRHESGPRKTLLWCIQHRLPQICYLLCWYKSR